MWTCIYEQLVFYLLRFCRCGPSQLLSEVLKIISDQREAPPLNSFPLMTTFSFEHLTPANSNWNNTKQCTGTYWGLTYLLFSSSHHSSLFIFRTDRFFSPPPSLSLSEFLRCLPLWISSINSYSCSWTFSLCLKGTGTVGSRGTDIPKKAKGERKQT